MSSLAPMVEEHIDDILNDFYARSGGFDHPGTTVKETESLEVIKIEQKRHFLELVDAGLDEAYFQNREVAGIFNENSGVSPAFYMGAYSYFLKRMS